MTTSRSHPVTVVVMTRNRREELLATLPRHEAPVIVVDDASSDGTAGAVRAAFPRARVLRNVRRRGASSRTAAARLCDTPYVAFADDDSWWAPGGLRDAIHALDASPSAAAVCASIVLGDEQRPDPLSALMQASPLPGSPDDPGPRIIGFAACATVVRRDAFLAVGGFDDVVRFPGEEERVALDLVSAGWTLHHLPDVTVHHHPSPVRDEEGRARAVARSRFLTALMRRPVDVVRREAAALGDLGGFERGAFASSLSSDALRAVARRRCLRPDVEAQVRLVEGVVTLAGP